MTMTTIIPNPPATVSQRVDALAWNELRAELDERGFAITTPLVGF